MKPRPPLLVPCRTCAAGIGEPCRPAGPADPPRVLHGSRAFDAARRAEAPAGARAAPRRPPRCL